MSKERKRETGLDGPVLNKVSFDLLYKKKNSPIESQII